VTLIFRLNILNKTFAEKNGKIMLKSANYIRSFLRLLHVLIVN